MSGVVVAVIVARRCSRGRIESTCVIALAIRREDRRYTLVREAPDRIFLQRAQAHRSQA